MYCCANCTARFTCPCSSARIIRTFIGSAASSPTAGASPPELAALAVPEGANFTAGPLIAGAGPLGGTAGLESTGGADETLGGTASISRFGGAGGTGADDITALTAAVDTTGVS